MNLEQLKIKLNNDKDIKKIKKEYKDKTDSNLKITLNKYNNKKVSKDLGLGKGGYNVSLRIEGYYDFEIIEHFVFESKKNYELENFDNIVFDFEKVKETTVEKMKKITDNYLKRKEVTEKLGYLK